MTTSTPTMPSLELFVGAGGLALGSARAGFAQPDARCFSGLWPDGGDAESLQPVGDPQGTGPSPAYDR